MISDFFGQISFFGVFSAFIFLIAIIDPVGNIPVTIDMEARGLKINSFVVCLVSFIILMAFLFFGDLLLKLFNIPIEYFAIAGGFIIFLMSMEMVFDMTFLTTPELQYTGSVNIVPLAFPLYAGPGTFTAVISLTAEYSTLDVLCAIVLNIIALYLILKGTSWLSKHLSQTTLYIIRKFFGIIVMAIAVKLMFGNLVLIFK